jgi:ribosome-associated toxin RatA of RatAB toxin-antitoxin module
MPEIRKTVLVGFSPEQMFALVDAVERYPEFLPWCGGASVSHRDEQRTRATIVIRYRGIKQSFTTENTKDPGRAMWVKLVEGPFKTLDGTWRFIPLAEQGCKIEFRLHYEFASRILETLVGPVFNYIANTFIDAFVRRAQNVYGSK